MITYENGRLDYSSSPSAIKSLPPQPVRVARPRVMQRQMPSPEDAIAR